MIEYIVKIQHIEQLTHDVKRFHVEKPAGYSFTPGQATGVAINSPEMRKKRRSFTFTGLNQDMFLEFTIKLYPEHDGLTKGLGRLIPGDELVIGNPWGAISYKGKGIFFAGGAGITPFLAIFRDLYSRSELAGNRLFYANKTRGDIILEEELHAMLGSDCINILSREHADGYYNGHISGRLLKEHVDVPGSQIYLCGPPEMMRSVIEMLSVMGVDRKAIIMEL